MKIASSVRVFLLPFLRLAAVIPAFALAMMATAGCAGPKLEIPPESKVASDSQLLSAGDVVRIEFPGAPNLNTQDTIRRDGRINLFIVGEFKVVGKTPVELENELKKVYDEQLVQKEIKVTVVSSAFSVFVTGAVMKPGKVTTERALTAFEAIMEAGGFDDNRANPKAVRVIRQDGGATKTYEINMKAVLTGRPTESFYLKQFDTVYVPEKVSWF